MRDDPRQFEPLESAMLELRAAEENRVFAETRLDAAALLQAAHDRPILRIWSGRRWLAVAASIVLAFGVWGSMFAYKLAEMRGTRATPGMVGGADDAGCEDCSFFGCFTGPTERIAVKCLTHDYDADGDVDLADFRQVQMRRRNG